MLTFFATLHQLYVWEPETSDCTDCVSQDQFDELYSMVMSQQETIEALEAEVASLAGLEETVTEVDQAMMDMATCMAAYVSGDDDEEPEMTEAPEPEETMPEMTEPEMTEPEMTEAPTVSPTMMTTTSDPTMQPTKAPTMMFMEASDYNGMVCADDETRTFKNAFTSEEACAERCLRDDNCMYFSYRDSNNDCIGCEVAPMTSSRFTTEYMSYMMMSSGRRQLSEVEALRRENAALKEALRQLRRN